MKKKLHYDEKKFLEYYYDPGAYEDSIGRHLMSCNECNSYYRELERFFTDVKSAFSEEPEINWEAQRRRITARLEETEKHSYAIPWLKLAPLAAAIIISVGLLFSFNGEKRIATTDDYYTSSGQSDELLLREIQNLIDKPLSDSMKTINFWMDWAEQGEQSGSLNIPVRSAIYEKN